MSPEVCFVGNTPQWNSNSKIPKKKFTSTCSLSFHVASLGQFPDPCLEIWIVCGFLKRNYFEKFVPQFLIIFGITKKSRYQWGLWIENETRTRSKYNPKSRSKMGRPKNDSQNRDPQKKWPNQNLETQKIDHKIETDKTSPALFLYPNQIRTSPRDPQQNR